MHNINNNTLLRVAGLLRRSGKGLSFMARILPERIVPNEIVDVLEISEAQFKAYS